MILPKIILKLLLNGRENGSKKETFPINVWKHYIIDAEPGKNANLYKTHKIIIPVRLLTTWLQY